MQQENMELNVMFSLLSDNVKLLVETVLISLTVQYEDHSNWSNLCRNNVFTGPDETVEKFIRIWAWAINRKLTGTEIYDSDQRHFAHVSVFLVFEKRGKKVVFVFSGCV